MFFLQAAKAPIPVTIDDKVYNVPKLKLKDLIEWGASIRAAKVAALTQGMDAKQSQEYLTFYDIPSPDLNEFRKLTVTPDGANYILRTQLLKAKAEDGTTPDAMLIDELLDNIPHGTRMQMAWTIGDMSDTSARNVQTPPPTANGGATNPPNALSASDKSA